MICPIELTLSQMFAHHSRKISPSGFLRCNFFFFFAQQPFMSHKMLTSRSLAMINLPEKESVIQPVLVRLTTVVCRGPWPVANNVSKAKTAAVSV